MVKEKIVCLFLAFLSVFPAFGDDFQEANQAYHQKDYTRAIALYNNLLVDGYQDEVLYYNLGNAYFKDGEVGNAILWYERALRLAPNNEDIIHNLAFANLSTIDKMEVMPTFFLSRWWKGAVTLFSPGTWSVISIVLSILFSLAVALVFVAKSPRLRLWSFWLSLIVALFLVLSLIFAALGTKRQESRKEVIVMESSQAVKSTPDHSGTTLFNVHEGIKGEICDKTGQWIEIRFINGEKGWIPSQSAEII